MLKYNNYYKTISGNMLVTQHDFNNYVMGFIKEDEIYNQEQNVSREREFRGFTGFNFNFKS